MIRNSFYRVKAIPSRATSVSIRCGQSTKEEGNLDVWLGRSAMVGFAVAISVEIATGKGLLEVGHLFSDLFVIVYIVSQIGY